MLIALGGAAAFVLIVALLHILKPDFDPSWRMISEYAIGRYGWIMRLAFFCLATSCFALAFALAHSASAVGDVLLAIAGVGVLGAGVFATDPITTPPQSRTLAGRLHNFFSVFFILGFPIAITFIGWTESGGRLARLRYWLPWMSLVVWASFIAFVAAMYYFRRAKRRLGPHTPVGWLQRFMIFTYTAWIVIVAVVTKL